jgi:hypothetical protein
MSSDLELEISNIINEPVPMQLGFNLDKANDIFISYIKKHKRIIYGGLAINEHLKYVDNNLAIYNASEPIADIDIYTPDPYGDAIAIADLLAKEFNYVQFIEAIHKGTFKIAIEFKYLYDLTFIPPSVFDTMPYIVYAKGTTNGSDLFTDVRFISPDFMFIDIYKSFTDISNCWRWEKDYKRMSLLLEHCEPFGSTSKDDKDVKPVKCPLIIPNGYTVTGVSAVTWYNSFVERGLGGVNTGTLELYGDITNAINSFDTVMQSKIVNVTHYKPFLNCLPESVRLNLQNKCTVWVYQSHQSQQMYTTFEETMLFLFSVLQRERSIQLLQYDPLKLVNKMYKLFNIYNKDRTALESDNPFRIFIDTGYKFYESVIYKMNIVNYHTKVFTMPYKPHKITDEQRQQIKPYVYIVNDGSVNESVS